MLAPIALMIIIKKIKVQQPAKKEWSKRMRIRGYVMLDVRADYRRARSNLFTPQILTLHHYPVLNGEKRN